MHRISIVVTVALLFCYVQCRTVDISTYGADFTGQSLSDTAFADAMTNAASGDTVVIPNGIFIISKPIKPKSGIILQGKIIL